MLRSEAMFMISLVQHSSDPWHIYALRSDPGQSWSYSDVEKIRVNAEAMREKELKRLEYLFALKLLKKVMEPAQTSKNKQRTISKRKGKGHKGKGKGDVSEESDGSGIDPHGLGPEEDPPHGGAPAPEEDPPHGDAPGSEPPVAAPEVAALEEDAPLGLGPETAAAPPPPPPQRLQADAGPGAESGNSGVEAIGRLRPSAILLRRLLDVVERAGTISIVISSI